MALFFFLRKPKTLLQFLILLAPISAFSDLPTFWNYAYQITIPETSVDRTQLEILREHNPSSARRQGAREFCIEFEKQNGSDYYLVIAHSRTQLESFLSGLSFSQIGNYQSAYWNDLVANFPALLSHRAVSSDHLNELTSPGRLDCFYDACMQSPFRLSADGDTPSPYADNAQRTAEYAHRADFTTFLLNQYRGLFVRFFDLDADGQTDIQVSRATKGSLGDYATSMLYDNPLLGNRLNTAELSVAKSLSEAAGKAGSFNGLLSYCWLKVTDSTVTIGDIRRTFIPDAVRVAVAGDSFSSGEGAPNEWYGVYNAYQWSPDSMSYYAHRSVNSHWHQSVKYGHRRSYNNLPNKHKTGMFYTNLSWSGAILYDLRQDDYWTSVPTSWRDYYHESTLRRKGALTLARQINAMPEADYDLICFSHSGNDAAFSDILTLMLVVDHSVSNEDASALYFDLIDFSGLSIERFWEREMALLGYSRSWFATNYIESNGTVFHQAPPLDTQFMLLRERLLNKTTSPASSSYYRSSFRNVLMATYPNPVGLPYGNYNDPGFGYPFSEWLQFQLCVPPIIGTGGIFGIEPDEARSIINFFMPEINDKVQNAIDLAPSGRVQQVGHEGSEDDLILSNHKKGALSRSPDRLFARIPGCLSLPPDAEEDPTDLYWFHPNRHGHSRLFVDGRDKIADYFESNYTALRFSIDDYPFYNPKETVVDLTFSESELSVVEGADTWQLKLKVQVENVGGLTSMPVYLMMRLTFNGQTILIPVYNLETNQYVVVPSLDGGESVSIYDTVLESDSPCLGTEYIVASLTAFINNAQYILDNAEQYPLEWVSSALQILYIGEDVNDLRDRVCGWVNLWNLHYNSPTPFQFYLPIRPNSEINEWAENNFGTLLNTWQISEAFVEDPKQCQRQSMLDCLLSRYEWLADALDSNEVSALVANGTEPFNSMLRDMNIKPSLFYSILEKDFGGKGLSEIPMEFMLEEAVAMGDPHGKGLLGGGSMVLFPPGIEPLQLRFPDYPNLILPYAEANRLSELFILDGTPLDVEVEFLLDGKPQSRFFKLIMPLEEFGVAYLGGERSADWIDLTPQVLVPTGFSPEHLQYVLADPLSATVLRQVPATSFDGSFRDLFRNLYFTKGLAKVCVNRLAIAEEKGYWIDASNTIGRAETTLLSVDTSSNSVFLRVDLFGELDSELIGGSPSTMECRLIDGFSEFSIPVSLPEKTFTSNQQCQLTLKIPLGLMRSQFQVLQIVGQLGDEIALAALQLPYLSEEDFANAEPYLYVDSVVEMTQSDFALNELPDYVYRDPIDGAVPAAVILTTNDTVAGIGSYQATLGVTNSRGIKMSGEIVLEIVPDYSPDSDGDGLDDAQEATLGTNPNAFDTDGDGISDRLAFINNFIGKNDYPVKGSLRMESPSSLRLDAIIGKRYQLEQSDDLINWEPYGEIMRAGFQTNSMDFPNAPGALFIRVREF